MSNSILRSARHGWRRTLLVVLPALLSHASIHAAEPAADDTVVSEAIVNAPAAEVWRLFTTPGGMESWMAAHADIDLRVGGLIRTHSSPEGSLGDDRTIVNQVISYEPERMLSIRVHKPPADFPFPRAVQNMWTVIYFQPLGAETTNIRIVAMGFGDDGESRKMREFFARGNAATLEKLQKKYWPLCARCQREQADGNR